MTYLDAKKEFLNSPLYKNNLVSDDFKTTAILVNLKENNKLSNIRDQIKLLKKKISNNSITEDELKVYNDLKQI